MRSRVAMQAGLRGTGRLCALALALAAGGCSGQRVIVAASSTTIVSPDLAFVSLGPGSPAVLSVVQTLYANATRQTIALETTGTTPGQNELRADIFGITNDTAGAETTLDNPPLGQAYLPLEAQTMLPTVPLRQSLNYVQNRYGPFGYAIGRSGQGDTCIYAWQRIATPETEVSVFNRRATISIRLRLCEPNAPESQLVASMIELHVNASISGADWSQDPKPLSPDIGAPGVPMGPPPILSAAENPAAAPVLAEPAVRRPRRGVPRQRPAPEPVISVAPPMPAATGPLVPPPPPVDNTRKAGGVVPPPPLSPGAQQ